jgi:hypothetical protein
MWQLKYLSLDQDLFYLTLLFLQSGNKTLHLTLFFLVTKQQQACTLKLPNFESLNNFSMQSILWIEAKHNNNNIKFQTTLILSSLLTQKPPFQLLLTKRRILKVSGANYLNNSGTSRNLQHSNLGVRLQDFILTPLNIQFPFMV